MASSSKYTAQRKPKTPPHVSLKCLRSALGLTIEQVIEEMRRQFPDVTTTKGAISAIENGHRGASALMLRALCSVYRLPEGSIVTDYEPIKRGEVAA